MVLLLLDVFPVAQQQPAGAFHHLARQLVVLEAVGLVDANPVDHLATVLGGHMKEVEDDLGPGALVADLGLEGGTHVHDHRLEPLARFEVIFSWTYRFCSDSRYGCVFLMT